MRVVTKTSETKIQKENGIKTKVVVKTKTVKNDKKIALRDIVKGN